MLQSNGYFAKILPERGGNCICLERDGIHALRNPKVLSDFETQNPFLYGMPLLFPPNRILGGSFSFQGRKYEFPINEPLTGCHLHGTLHATEFCVLHRSENHVSLGYYASENEPYLCFPHAFSIEMEYSLNEGGLFQTICVTNDSRFDMPVFLGLHTTFLLPTRNAKLTLSASREYLRDTVCALPNGVVVEDSVVLQDFRNGSCYPSEHPISALVEMGPDRVMLLKDPLNGYCIRYQVNDAFRYWMVYNTDSSDFICVEPQSWLSNCPNAPFDRQLTGFDVLKPGASRIYNTNLSIETK